MTAPDLVNLSALIDDAKCFALGVTAPVAIGTATGLPPSVAVRLLTRRQWREGDAAALRGCRPAGAGRPARGLNSSATDGDAS